MNDFSTTHIWKAFSSSKPESNGASASDLSRVKMPTLQRHILSDSYCFYRLSPLLMVVLFGIGLQIQWSTFILYQGSRQALVEIDSEHSFLKRIKIMINATKNLHAI